MRGSPIFRTVIVLVLLAVAAAGLSMLGRGRAPSSAPEPPGPKPSAPEAIAAPFVLTLSHPASAVVIEAGDERLTPPTDDLTAGGVLTLDGQHQVIFITIDWRDRGDAPRFAKLTLEPIGRPTLTRTFDSVGDLADVWEINLGK